MKQEALSGGFFDRLWQLSGGDPFLFWLPVGLAAVAGGVAFFLVRDIWRTVQARRWEQGMETARRIQAELNRKYGAKCADSVRVALRQGNGISEGLQESDGDFYAGLKDEGRRGWDS